MNSRCPHQPAISVGLPAWSRRDFLGLLAAGSLSVLARAQVAPLSTRSRTNVLMIVADDMGFADLGCYGSEIHTPNLDRLAHGGMRYAQAYSFARCCPSRAALLTGLPPQRAGLGFMVSHDDPPLANPVGYQGFIRGDVPIVAEVLRQAGYRTGLSGKWHVGEHRPHWPCDRGFDESWGLIGGACSYFDPSGNRAQRRHRQLFHNDRQLTVNPVDGFYFTDEIARHAITQIREATSMDRPFFHYIGFTAPHWPLHARPEDIALYRGRYRAGWDEVRLERHQRQIDLGLVNAEWGLAPRDISVTAWHDLSNPEEMAHKMAVYAAQIHRLDHQVGRILDALEATGQRENTLVLFVSDNGGDASLPPVVDPSYHLYDAATLGGPRSYTGYGPGWGQVSNTPFRRYKRYAHEGGVAVPMIVNGPGLTTVGDWCRMPVTFLDIVPTVLAAAGVTCPGLPGRNLADAQAMAAPFVHGWEHMGHHAYRVGDQKLVAADGEPWELYDLASDRCELRDLAGDRPDELAALTAQYDDWARSNAVLPWPVALNGSFG
uniref:arylsulfatase n=1 Tax=Cephaloticoccus sp. TaxID=1985742 RepID=UPI00404A6D09